MTPEEAAKAVVKAIDDHGICERVVGDIDHQINLTQPESSRGLWPDLQVKLWHNEDEVQVVLYGKTTVCPSAHLERHMVHLFKGLMKNNDKRGVA